MIGFGISAMQIVPFVLTVPPYISELISEQEEPLPKRT